VIKLAFIINFNKSKWNGGFTVIINLIKAILEDKKHLKKLHLCLIVPNKKIFKNSNILDHVEVIEDKEITNPIFLKKIIDKILLILIGKTFFLENKLKSHQINMISHTNFCTGNKSSIRSILWIPDFQFFYFKKYFSLKYMIFKKINLLIYSKHSDKILLSSQSARNDLKKICLPAYKISTVNSFCFKKPKSKIVLEKRKILNKHELPRKFFYLPNQYWIHKNHIVVLKALKSLVKKHKKIKIVSTGLNYDYRFPNYFNNISEFIVKNNLKKNYIYLGFVPFSVTEYLISKCIAVINPSKFEGWNTSVEQAKAFNKKIILSNIPAHKEQKPIRGTYFKANNYLQLAKIIKNMWYSKKKISFNKQQSKINRKFLVYGREFTKIVFNISS
jgi:glycosyltransferase involved in cell wall biosynthesis